MHLGLRVNAIRSDALVTNSFLLLLVRHLLLVAMHLLLIRRSLDDCPVLTSAQVPIEQCGSLDHRGALFCFVPSLVFSEYSFQAFLHPGATRGLKRAFVALQKQRCDAELLNCKSQVLRQKLGQRLEAEAGVLHSLWADHFKIF